MSTEIVDINILLRDAGNIIEKYEMLSRETGNTFNIFEIAGVSTKETMVCRVLAELLNPDGRHGQGYEYLNQFLSDCLGLHLSDQELRGAKVYREYPAQGRRIDIVINVGSRFIPIEVKIYADDGDDQCYDYYQFAMSRDSKTKVVYLTPFGEKPPDKSARELSYDAVLPISFANDIKNWLEKCLALPETIRKTPVREILLQFLSTIRGFTNQLEDKPMNEMIKLLTSSEQNMRKAIAIADTLEACEKEVVHKFFSAFQEKFDAALELIPLDNYNIGSN